MDEKQRDLLKRKALFVPCASKAHLYVWIKEYLGIDVPDTKVDPESTSTPMDTIWEIYEAAIKNDPNEKKSYLAYASRDSFKTLGAAILEVLAVVHLRRDVAHMAAILVQAKKAQSYVKSFFHKPYLRDYVVSENATRLEISRFYNEQTGENLTAEQFRTLDEGSKLKYNEIRNYITVVVCTMAGANSEHVNFFCVDGSTHVSVKLRGFPDVRSVTIEQLYECMAADNLVGNLTTEHIVDSTGNFKVLAYDHEARKSKLKDIEIVHRRQVNSTVTIQFDGTMLCCTPDHPLFVPGAGYVEAKDLKKGDVVLGIEAVHNELVGRRVLSVKNTGSRTVYDLTVNQFHNFFTNGVLSHNCVDELDVIENPKAYEEAKMIPAPRDGKLPITFYTSTRKFSYGLVQKEIDNAQKTELKIRHWNIIDVTEKCPAERHLPDLPMIDVYYSNQELTTVLPEEYETFSSERKEKFSPDKAYTGCVKNCKMFAMCRGKLATIQKDRDTKTKADYLLKPIAHTQNQFSNVSVEHAKAQLLCWKPSTEGLIYPNFDRDIHMLTPAQMAEFITGEEHPEDMTKLQLISLLKTREVKFVAGMDFGYTHNFSVALGAIEGNRCFVLDVISQPELEVEQQIELCNETIRHYNPKIYADPENPQAIVTFRKRGYRITKVEKGKGSVIGGIELVRQVLKPATGRPRLFFLKDDPGCEFMAKRLAGYHWKTDAAGTVSNIPDDTDDDECDALRYLVMSAMGKTGKLTISHDKPGPTPQEEIRVQQDWMSKAIQENVGAGPAENAPAATGKKGGFFWNLG